MYEESWRYYDAIYEPLKDYEKESQQLWDQVSKLAGQQPETWLDVACGTGLHAEHLSKWCDFTGVDLNHKFVRLAQERAPDATILQGDMRAFNLGKQYDVVSCLFSAVGHLESARELTQTFGQFAGHLAPGGIIIVEPWIFPDEWQEGLTAVDLGRREDEQIARLALSKRDGEFSIFELQYNIVSPRGFRQFRETGRHRLHSDAEYLKAFKDAGLVAVLDKKGPMGRGLYIARRPR